MVIVVDHTEVCFYVCIFCKALPGPLFFLNTLFLKKLIYVSILVQELWKLEYNKNENAGSC